MSVRAGHEWYTGSPGCFTDAQLKKLEGRWIACPDSTVESFEAGKGNVAAIIAKFKTRFPSLEPPRFVSACTKAIEGDGGLREVLIAKDAVWAGCKPPMVNTKINPKRIYRSRDSCSAAFFGTGRIPALPCPRSAP